MPLMSNTNIGLHTVMNFRPQTVDPTTTASQVALYNKLDVNSIPELFFRPSGNQTPIQLTYPSISTPIGAAQQYTFCAGPFVIYGGLIANATNGQVVTLTPTSTLIYVGLTNATSIGNPVLVRSAIPTNITGSSFTISWQTDPQATLKNIYYLAIGK